MQWFILFVAGLFEVIWAIGLKYTHGFTRPLPSLLVLGALSLSFLLLSWSMKTLPAGTAYAIWSSIGAALVGMSVLGEAVTAGRIISLYLLIAGIAGLKYFTPQRWV
ncbi:Quaternary ammonium compound-resistance protein SugE [Sodalis glossinidius str. 'morsitans']|uniref:Guanidinium exporter n=1 Tax=Sodalis glossinidius (strain morsitans) TaxID=343509 RepID=Q2NSC8_SODGM|nr:SMR family transporter [Sodalis glossinidius]BAE74947.1 GroEL supressor protein SugE [Sodalis glossinidius str. 'morsitans']CRL45818.1 Quaternary ammonium compound-resistance protein SugE [Sodalis glossinidius str. 'morsitans']